MLSEGFIQIHQFKMHDLNIFHSLRIRKILQHWLPKLIILFNIYNTTKFASTWHTTVTQYIAYQRMWVKKYFSSSTVMISISYANEQMVSHLFSFKQTSLS